jgi:hypothetical protein
MLKWILSAIAVVIAIAVGAWWFDRHSARAALLEQPVYRVLEKHEAQLFDDLANEYRLYRNDEVSREQFINYANNEISNTATRALARASQDSLLALVRDMVSTAQKLQAAPGDVCYRYWFPKVEGPADVARYIDAKSQAHTLGLMGEVIRTAAEHPVPLPDPESVKGNLAAIVNATFEEYGSDAQMLAHADDPRVDRGKVCAVTISLYRRILQLPPADAGALLRTMASAVT